MSEGLMRCDEHGMIVDASLGMRDVLGWEACELIGMHVTELIVLRLQVPHVTAFAAAVGRRYSRIVRNAVALAKDGSEVPVVVETGSRDEGGELIFLARIVKK